MTVSPTGLDWASRGPNTTLRLQDFAESPDRFVVIATQKLFVSEDSFNWTEIESGAQYLNSLNHRNGVFLLGAGLGKTLLISEDGLAWTDRAVGAQVLRGFSYFKSSHFAVGHSGMILQSAPASVPEFLSLVPEFEGIHVMTFGEIGREYELESTTDFATWQHEQDYQQAERTQPLTLPTGPEQRFYRIKLKEP
jgi:hypothetical protein